MKSNAGFSRAGIRFLLIGLLGIAAADRAAAQEPAAPAAAETPRAAADFDAAAMTRRLAELRPDLEAILGESLGPPVEVCASDTKEAVAILVEETVLARCNMVSQPDPARYRKSVRFQTGLLADGLMGKVDLAGGRIHVFPGNLKKIGRLWRREDTVLSRDFLDVVLAHEAAHVHQHRRFGLAALFCAPVSEEHQLCVQAVTEGHAEWVAARFAERRGLQPVHAVYRSFFTGPPDDIDPLAAGIVRLFSQVLAFPYLKGAEFHAAVVGRLGPGPAFERVMTDTPLDRELIRQPDTYLGRTIALPPAAAEPPARTVAGSVTVAGAPSAGGLEVHLWVGAPVHRLVVARGRDGACEARVPEGAPLRAGLVILDGARHTDFVGEPVEIRDDGTFALRLGTGPEERTILVTDAATGAPVPGARVWPRRAGDRIGWLGEKPETPEDEPPAESCPLPPMEVLKRSPVTGDDAGRVAIPGGRDGAGIWVTAPGRCFATATWEELDRHGNSVALRPGGSLRLEIPAFDRVPDAKVFSQYLCRTADGTFDLRYAEEVPFRRDGDIVEVIGLPAAFHVITVRSGAWYKDGAIHDTRPVEVRPGEPVAYRVDIAGLAARTDRALVLQAPAAWGNLRRQPAGLLGSGGATKGLELTAIVKWDAGTRSGRAEFKDVAPGAYELRVPDFGWVRPIDIDAGAGDVPVALPEPVTVEVRVVDALTGEPVRKGRLAWKAKVEEPFFKLMASSMVPGRTSARIDQETGVARLLVAAGKIEVEPDQDAYVEEETVLDVAGPGPMETTLKLRPAGQAHVVLRKDGAQFRGSAAVSLDRVSESELASQPWISPERNAAGRFAFARLEPGRWKASVTEVDGAAKPDPVEFEVRPRETAEVAIDLRP